MRRLALALALAGLAACAPREPERPNLLLVTVDTLRPDHLSAYGWRGPRTPHIDRLAEQGALFERAFADVPWTTPSMSSVMTGTYATRHGFKSTITNRLGLDNVTLAEVLHAHGWHTAAVIGSFPLDSIYQLDQGFEHYDDTFTRPIWIHPDVPFEHRKSEFRKDPEQQAMFEMAKSMSDSRRTDAEVTDAALAWLHDRPPGPFFLWVHYFGPHSKPDWRIPEARRMRHELERYEPDVVENDRQVGRLLAALDAAGLAEDTLVAFHADHGESLGEQGYVGHGNLLNLATMHIPLILRWPGHIAAGVRVTSLARNVDLLPTLLDAAGLPAPPQVQGQSLLPEVRVGARGEGAAQPPRSVYMETYYPAHAAFATPVHLPDGSQYRVGTIRRGVSDGRWELVRTEPHRLLDASDEDWDAIPKAALDAVRHEELFDLSAPRGSGHDVLSAHPDVARRLRAELDARIAEDRGAAPHLELAPEMRQKLRSLGYAQ